MKNCKSISDNDIVFHRALNQVCFTSNQMHFLSSPTIGRYLQVRDMTFDDGKKERRVARNRVALRNRDTDVIRRSTLSIRTFLRDFCLQFLENCFNPLMNSVKVRLHFTTTSLQPPLVIFY